MPEAGAVVVGHVAALVDELDGFAGPAADDAPDAVHQMRVRSRRLRSSFATFGRLLDRSRSDPLRDELTWLAAPLGRARDAEVQHERLRSAVLGLPVELRVGPVLDRIDIELGRQHADALDEVREVLVTERYRTLVDGLRTFVADPPLRGRAHRAADPELGRLVERSCGRVTRAAQAIDPTERGRNDHDALHELRKAAKRARYAGEAVEAVFGRPAIRLADRMEALQDALGEHQDTVVTRQIARHLGVAAHLAGENGFTFGLLHGLEAGRSADALAPLPRLVRRAVHRTGKARLA